MADIAPVTTYVGVKRAKGFEAGGYRKGRKAQGSGKNPRKRRTVAHATGK